MNAKPLTEAQIAEFRVKRAQGWDWDQIALWTMPSRPVGRKLSHQVSQTIKRLGLPPIEFVPDISYRLKIVDLYRSGLGYREIARRLGIGPGTVSGYIRRHRLANGEPTNQRDQIPIKPKKQKPLPVAKAPPKPAKVRPVRVIIPDLPPQPPKPFINRRIGYECAYIEGDARISPVMCCGAPTGGGSSWCSRHLRTVTSLTLPRSRARDLTASPTDPREGA